MPKTQQLAVARQLHTEAGRGPGKQLKVELRLGDSEFRQKMAQAVARQWKEALGVEAQVVASLDVKAPEDTAVGVLTVKGWVADCADANSFDEIWLSDSTENTFGYSNHKYDSLVSNANSERNPAERAQVLEQAELTLLNDYPMIPIFDFVPIAAGAQNGGGICANIHRSFILQKYSNFECAISKRIGRNSRCREALFPAEPHGERQIPDRTGVGKEVSGDSCG